MVKKGVFELGDGNVMALLMGAPARTPIKDLVSHVEPETR
jgi:hypothetical protein